MNHRARYILVLIRSQCNAPCILVGIGPVHVLREFIISSYKPYPFTHCADGSSETPPLS
ncbi:hypothetical protein HanXRQr2_Chr02g0051651 [Helianthus annuus]|uniref:Uncharacterized protein n=1 Tax=Helianthus annuus TaxID=4232 RepID=A0A9K3JLI7_HELAN|nr:hypothetical protein HanXRQr2_Chr02g0051651 [Helianthus annuus]